MTFPPVTRFVPGRASSGGAITSIPSEGSPLSHQFRRPGRAAGQFLTVLTLASAAMMLAAAAPPVQAQATPQRITGTVSTDAGQPLPSAQVSIVGTTLGAITNEEGRFTILGVAPGTMEVRAVRIGYSPQTRTVVVASGETATVNFSLTAVPQSLEAVVAVGYTNQARRDISGAVSSVGSEAIENRQVATVQEALRGRIPGVQISSSGEPGEASRVVIRGQNFLQGSEPLYVVDGLYMRQNPNLNPNDIASVEVLKDASAASQYGAQAANGVVVITTRRGSGDPQLAVRSYYGVQSTPETIDMAGPQRWAEINQMAYENVGLEAPQGTIDVLEGRSTVNTDWQDAIFRQGNIQDHVLQMSGGSENANYMMSGGYFQQDGIIINTNFERYSFRLNSEMRRGRFTFGENIALARAHRRIPIGNQLIDALRFPPVIPVRDPNSASGYGVGTDAIPTFGYNPVGGAELRNEQDRSHQAFGTIFGEVGILDNLRYRLNVGFNYNDGNWRQFTQEGFPVRQNESRNPAALIDQRSTGTMLQLENLLTYEQLFGRHAISAVAGYSEQSETFNRLEASRSGFPDPTLTELDAGTSNQANVGFRNDARLQSFLARANYTLAERYLFSGSIRRDGSSRFGANNRYGTFGAGSVGWIISDENFFRNSAPGGINFLKLRASYGTLGNQDFADYQYSSSIVCGGFGLGGTGYPLGPTQTVRPGCIQRSLSNPDIRWQENTEANFGVDLGVLDNLFSVTADYYTREAKGLLVQAPIPSSLGAVGAPFVNAGTMKNSGFELGLNMTGLSRGALEMDFAATLTANRNEVTSLGNGAQPIFVSVENYQMTRTSVGAPIGTFYLYDMVGIFQSQEEIDSYTTTVDGDERVIQPGAAPGDVKYRDISGDGMINDDDRYAAGHGIPDFEGGVFMNSRYGSFDVAVGMQYSVGGKVMNVARWWTERMDDPTNYRADLRPWTEDNPSSTTPRALKEGPQASSNARLNSDRWMEDGSFLRLQNLQLGYILPASLSRNAGLRGDSRVYVNFQNLLTLSGYDGLDPEATGIVYNDSRDALLRGVDAGQIYPNPRTITVGMSIGF